MDFIRRGKLKEIEGTLFIIDLTIQKNNVFLYTDENYSHINNKFDIDDNEHLKDIKVFSNYMHAKYIKQKGGFGEKDAKLIDELRNIEKLHELDIEFDEDVYLYIFKVL